MSEIKTTPVGELLESLDWNLTCEYSELCEGATAEYLYYLATCSCTWLMCQKCADYVVQRWRNYVGYSYCRKCDAPIHYPEERGRMKRLP